MAARHFAVTVLSLAVWAALVWGGAGWIAERFPGSGSVLGFAGTLLLFWPTASTLAWDVVERFSASPLPEASRPVAQGEGYDPFTWTKLAIIGLGITLVGLGFAVQSMAQR